MRNKDVLIRFLILEDIFYENNIELVKERYYRIYRILKMHSSGSNGKLYRNWINGIFEEFSNINDVRKEYSKHLFSVFKLSNNSIDDTMKFVKSDKRMTRNQLIKKLISAFKEALKEINFQEKLKFKEEKK